MAVYHVSYDLKKTGQNYDGLYDELKKYEWLHILGSTWLVSTNENATQLRERLMTKMDSNDSLFISRVNRGERDGWLIPTYWDWINQRT